MVQSDTGTENGGTTTSGSLESFDVIVSDLTQILCSEDEATVIASAQSVHYYTSYYIRTCMSDTLYSTTYCVCVYVLHTLDQVLICTHADTH